MNLNWSLKTFSEFTAEELYTVLALRSEVFVVEQNCPYQDVDGKDLKSLHLMGSDGNGVLLVYSRIVLPGVSYDEVSIGRVVASPLVRGSGAGKALMKRSLEVISEKFGDVPVRIGAQCYLQNFYEAFGFKATAEPYMEDGIPHVIMLRESNFKRDA